MRGCGCSISRALADKVGGTGGGCREGQAGACGGLPRVFRQANTVQDTHGSPQITEIEAVSSLRRCRASPSRSSGGPRRWEPRLEKGWEVGATWKFWEQRMVASQRNVYQPECGHHALGTAAWPRTRPPVSSYPWQQTVPNGLRLAYRPGSEQKPEA